ncbi:hypothetical protein [Burkholderia anthina]|uniref:hypothetical protein n=1 Tax=Burkholderia anthina TaxID=179879 RepID=UPI00158B34EC|nr:hypothetical protein [Burkholderia anthina]
MINSAHVFGALRIIEDANLDDMPRMTVSTRFAELMPAEFVTDLNAWMLDFFGTENRIYRVGGDTVYMGPKSIAALKAQLARGAA